MKREDGFTLVEMLVVVAIIGILSSMAIMSVWKARGSANEASAIGTMRTISSGQVTYAATCGRGGFAIALPTLGPQGGAAPFLSPDLTAGVAVQKSGFRFGIMAATGSVPLGNDCNGIQVHTSFYAWAEPLLFGTSGGRSFATNAQGGAVVWQNFSAVAPQEPFAAPDTPIQ